MIGFNHTRNNVTDEFCNDELKKQKVPTCRKSQVDKDLGIMIHWQCLKTDEVDLIFQGPRGFKIVAADVEQNSTAKSQIRIHSFLDFY